MRCDQFMGLNEWAGKLVEGCGKPHYFGESKPTVVALGSDHETAAIEMPWLKPCVRKEESGEFYYGMFEDRYPLYKYTLQDGRVFYERIQAEPWSSGPVFFLALVDEKGNWLPDSLWPDHAVENA